MPKVESIRPGGTLESSFERYPLPELLIGILRGNLTGRLEVALHPEPRNFIYFTDGVPVMVSLPDTQITMVKLLMEQGSLQAKAAQEIMRAVEVTGRSEPSLFLEHGLMPKGRLDKALRLQARAQVVALFDMGSVEYRFAEGRERPEGEVMILETLPIVYEGLRKSRDAARLARGLDAQELERSFILAGTYPKGVDPFQWGPQVSNLVEAAGTPLSIGELVAQGIDPQRARAVFLSLRVAGMLEFQESAAASAPPTPSTPPTPVAPPLKAPSVVGPDLGGLMIHRKSSAAGGPSVSKSRPGSAADESRGASSGPVEPSVSAGEDVARCLSPFENKSYYQILRVVPGTEPKQLERAYRFSLRQLEEQGPTPGALALRGLLDEAYAALVEPDRERKYRAMLERSETSSSAKRDLQIGEAEPKVERAMRALGASRLAEAHYLLRWAERLDPVRQDVQVYLELHRFEEDSAKVDIPRLRAAVFAESKRRPSDPVLKLCMGLLFARDREFKTAKGVLDEARLPEHPMTVLIRGIIRTG